LSCAASHAVGLSTSNPSKNYGAMVTLPSGKVGKPISTSMTRSDFAVSTAKNTTELFQADVTGRAVKVIDVYDLNTLQRTRKLTPSPVLSNPVSLFFSETLNALGLWWRESTGEEGYTLLNPETGEKLASVSVPVHSWVYNRLYAVDNVNNRLLTLANYSMGRMYLRVTKIAAAEPASYKVFEQTRRNHGFHVEGDLVYSAKDDLVYFHEPGTMFSWSPTTGAFEQVGSDVGQYPDDLGSFLDASTNTFWIYAKVVRNGQVVYQWDLYNLNERPVKRAKLSGYQPRPFDSFIYVAS